MFYSRWVCPWKTPDRPFVSPLGDGPPRKKLPMQPMHLPESRSEPKTHANMPSLRQLEFTFTASTIRVGTRGDVQDGTRCPQRVGDRKSTRLNSSHIPLSR